MLNETTQRQRAAIFVADAVGYSTLMGADEELTYQRHNADFRNVLQPKISIHDGRVIKRTGDGVLATFPSACKALECAADMQTELRDLASDEADHHSLVYRMGINLGEIIVDKDDVYGDAVNVATRLESLADPGGIALSGAAYWNVKERTRYKFEEMGFLSLKNIVRPIEVYRVVEPAGSNAPIRLAKNGAEPDVLSQAKPAPAKVWSDAKPPHPSVVVLPFANLSQDPEQDYFCDGLTKDLTTDLSKFPNLTVIASNSAFSYKGLHPSPSELREVLGAEYVVEGSVQRMAGQVRINAQLVETKSNHQVWADRMQGSVVDLFALQDEVASKIVSLLASKLSMAERTRVLHEETDNISAYDAFLRGLHFMDVFFGRDETHETLQQSQIWLERAIEIDANYARAWGWLSYVLVQRWLHGWDNESVLNRSLTLAKKAVTISPSDYDTHWALGSVLSNSGQFEQAMVSYSKAIELNINDADLHAEMAEMLSFMGQHIEAIAQLKYAMRLNPHFPDWYRWTLGWCYYFIQEYDEAISELEKIINPSDEALLILAASHAQLAQIYGKQVKSDPKEATQRKSSAYLAEFLDRRPNWSVAKQRSVTRIQNDHDLEHWLEGLSRAGLPDRSAPLV